MAKHQQDGIVVLDILTQIGRVVEGVEGREGGGGGALAVLCSVTAGCSRVRP